MWFIKESEHLSIPFQEIEVATKNFTTLIGKGGYGKVYRGELSLSGKLLTVAVKRLPNDNYSGQGIKEFLTEIQLLSRYKHPNLVSLIGYCEERNEKILIYEYAERGSLDQYLTRPKKTCLLTWAQRIKICIDAACGLDYLHSHVAENQRVIHRDIKSANILLGQNWNAMISDFGLSKIGRANENETFIITNASGTHGYCDPQYIKTGILTSKSDVYSFGVVLLEVICGRLSFVRLNGEKEFLAPLAQRYYEEGKLYQIVDPDLKDQTNSNSLNTISEIAYQCLQDDRERRPSMGLVIEKLKAALDLHNGTKITEISESSQCLSLRLPKDMRVTKISWLMYTNSGNAILALASNGIHMFWKWQHNESDSTGKEKAGILRNLAQPSTRKLMFNDMAFMNPEESVSCFALSKDDANVISTSGGKISLFDMITFETMSTFMAPPPAATFLDFYPQDHNIIAIGMDDSTIQIIHGKETITKLKGHSERITGLAFSEVLNVLVSSGADSQLCVWNLDGWEKRKAEYLQLPPGRTMASQCNTRVEFHKDQIHFLVVHDTQLAIYETPKLKCVKQWVQRESSVPISHATFSCDSQLVYACSLDATVCVFTASQLCLRCRINPSAYLSPMIHSNLDLQPLVVAAHPQEPNRFAIGLSNGVVHILEPLESEGKWGLSTC